MKDILSLSDEEILTEAKRLAVGYAQKHIIRYGTEREENIHAESDAEHVFGLIYLAQYFLMHEPSAQSLDKLKVIEILLYHDFPEIKYGDVVTYAKTDSDIEKENNAAKEVFESLPESLQQVAHDRWEEYENHTTAEGKFCYALDKIEPLFELMDPVAITSIKRLHITREMHVGNKYKAAADFPLMLRFTDVITKDWDKQDIFWKE
ncbi:MAG TPA: HD domain-containing protein [Candidatus Paceibacterota bacterium]|nr:HD domain-containing protein [Candidatus Paceibacterota bacterium]